jgi:uncharacterized protein YecA (UPF0149 family)
MNKQQEAIAKFREFQVQQVNERRIREGLLKKGAKRNTPCWCGSGLKYKRCHWLEDKHADRKITKTTVS